ncbi:MAG: zf-HC2 domain-containing protein [Candidatus Krumholzibacteria bacterium]|nr:zf-HC2 domain-containing protein [Candidatus Krumholzibacteria bacterium]
MMNRCREIEIELAAFAGGELGPTEREQVRCHLNECAECRAELAREMTLRETLGGLPGASSPVNLDNRIRAAVHAAEPDSPSLWSRYRLGTAITIAAAGLALALILPNPGRGPAPQQSWTDKEIAAAREEVVFSLALTARVLDRTQKSAIIEVFANQLPNSVNESLKLNKPAISGGNG